MRTLIALVAGVVVAHGASAPTLEHLYPAGAVPGALVTVAASGKFDPWPVQVWIEGDGVTFLAQTNQGRFAVSVATNALPGPRLVRLHNAEGASDPRIFVIGEVPDLAEREPNNTVSAAQAITNLPVTVEGRLDQNGDVDGYAVALAAGQWLEARLDAYTLMSKVDAVLRVVTTTGQPLAWNHDWASLDPRILWRSPVAQSVVVQVFGFRYPADSSIQLTGGEGAVYRLHLAVGNATPAPPAGGRPETEPNDTTASAQTLELPSVVDGTIGADTDEDRFAVAVAKDARIAVRVDAAGLGSPLDAWVRIEDGNGKELAANDDSDGSSDPRLDWRAPGEGRYVVVVGSTLHRGGPEYRYRLSVMRGEPGFQGTSSASAFSISAGTTNEVKWAVRRRHGHTNELRASFRNLPEGVTAAPVVAPVGDGEVALKLIAAPSAAPFGGPVLGVIVDAATGHEEMVGFDLVSRGENNGVPQGWSRLLVERTSTLWLTVRPTPAPAPAPAAAAGGGAAKSAGAAAR